MWPRFQTNVSRRHQTVSGVSHISGLLQRGNTYRPKPYQVQLRIVLWRLFLLCTKGDKTSHDENAIVREEKHGNTFLSDTRPRPSGNRPGAGARVPGAGI